MVDLELYRVFYTVARCGNLTKASEQLYISQPAVSQAIKQLETQLGLPLFIRTRRGVELTEQGGKLIYREVEDALKLLDNAENKLSEAKQSPTGTIRLGATESIFSHILSDKIVQFHNRYPGVRFELTTGTTPDTIQQLKNNRIDIGFINMPIENGDVNFLSTVTRLHDIFVANDKYAHLKDRVVEVSELTTLPLLMIEANTVARRSMREYTRSLGVNLTADIEVASWDFMLKLVSSGMGVGCIPREYCQKELESGQLFALDVRPTMPVRGVGIAVPKNVTPAYAVQEFVRLFTGN